MDTIHIGIKFTFFLPIKFTYIILIIVILLMDSNALDRDSNLALLLHTPVPVTQHRCP